MLKLKSIIITLLNYILIIFFGLFAASCQNPFTTREPEPPVSNQSTWIQPTSANYVLVNLTNAINEKNITNYIRCLADTNNSKKSFLYLAEPSIALKNPGLFSQWQKEDELNFLNQMMLYLPKDSTSKLLLKSLRENSFQDSVILVKEYTLKLGLNCNNDCPKDLQGQAEFRLSKTDEDLWFIHKWSDFSIGDQSTWSELRSYFGK